MGNLTTDETAKWKKAWQDESDEALIQTLHTKVRHAPQHIAAQQLLDERRQTRQEKAHSEQIAAISEIDKKVEEISQRLRTSEWKTWTLWFAFFGVLLMAGTILRDYFDWTKTEEVPPTESPAFPDPQSETTTFPEEEDGLPREPETPEPSKTKENAPPGKRSEQGEDTNPDPAPSL